MAQTLSKIYLHIVFSTKNRKNLIDKDIEMRLYAYVSELSKEINCNVLAIGGTENHLHVLSTISRNISVSDYVKKIKSGSSGWIKSQSIKYNSFYWQNGYGVFSVSESMLERTKNYIFNQKSHHRKISFKDEYLRLLDKHQIGYDENFLWS